MLKTNSLQVSGRGTNVDFTIDDSSPFDVVVQDLRDYLSRNRAWCSRGTITVNVGRRMLSREEMTQIKQILERDSGLTVARFWCAPTVLEEALSENVGLGVALSPQIPSAPPSRQRPAERPEIEKTLPVWEQAPPQEHVPDATAQESPSWAEQEAKQTGVAPNVQDFQNAAFTPPGEPDSKEQAQNFPPPPFVTRLVPQGQAVEESPPPALDETPAADTPETASPLALEDGPSKGAKRKEKEEAQSASAPAPSRTPDTGWNRGIEALLVKTTCRSGEIVRYPGDVIVMADVNPGAEIIADGDILVFGSLRGLAHAGASGDPQATIIALKLESHRLQIGPYTGAVPRGKQRSKTNSNGPQIAYVRRRAIYVAPYAGRFARYDGGGVIYDG